MLWCVSCPALADYGISCPALICSGILLVSSGWLWYVSVLSSGCALACLGWLWVSSGYPACYPLACLGWLWVSSGYPACYPLACLGWLWVCYGMSHGLLCPDDVLCKNRPCPNITLWILSIHVNLELIYEFIYTCQ